MNDIYMLDILSFSEEYIVPELNDNIRKLKTHFYRDERWYLDSSPEVIGLDTESSGIEIPDILYKDELILFSDKMKKRLDDFGADYIFYKKIIVSDEILGIEEIYWLASIPRIDCIDFEKSDIQNISEYDYNDGIVPFYNIPNPVIIPECCGRYEIFRILGSDCNRVYLSQKLYENLKNSGLTGLDFRKLKNKGV